MTEPNRQSEENEEGIIEIEIERLRPFKEHPFQVKDDKEMFLLQESIEKYGILNPLIVRPVPDGYYEIISGHRRKHAAEKLGYRKVPVIIRVLSEDDSILSMVDSNLHRERISYSEKAFAYKLKNDVLKRKSGRNKWPVWGAGGKDGSVNYFQFIDADGTISEPMGIAARRVMNTNDVVRMVTATGGGYGDPFKRPADKVAMDVKNEYITVDQAKEDYGVLVDPETFKVLGLTEERQKAEK